MVEAPPTISLPESPAPDTPHIDAVAVSEPEVPAISSLQSIDFEDYWKRLLLHFADKPLLHSALSQSTYGITGDFAIEVCVPTSTLKNVLEEFKMDLALFFKQQISISEFQCVFKVEKAEEFHTQSFVPEHSPMAKFRKLAELNPNLLILSEKLGLEPRD